MNREQNSSSVWPHNLQEDPMVGGGDDELSKYLDLGIDFPDFEGLEDAPSGLDTPMGRLGFEQFQQLSQMQSEPHGTMEMDLGPTPTTMVDFGAMHTQGVEAPSQEQDYRRQMQHSYMVPSHDYRVPLTPVSSEMHAAKYGQHYDNDGHVAYDRYQQSFTPLVSPAQTPLEGSFSIPDYSAQHDFFSPLTSPAMEAQHGTGTTASPIDLNADGLNLRIPPTSAAKRSRRKPSTSTRTPGSGRSVKQSPAMKPQTKRRQPSLTKIPADVLESLAQDASNSGGPKPSNTSVKVPASSDSSVSPEPLSESLMPPPAIPRPASRSPNIAAQRQGTEGNAPATPATLMRLPSTKTRSGVKGVPMKARLAGDDVMEDIMLPESATRPILSALDTSESALDDGGTPTISAKSIKINAASTPRTSAMTPSVLSPGGGDMPRRTESKTSIRSSKKRQGTSSATISPALRPKISPSITPLMPASAPGAPHISAETSALYLASKSNYQNILEGTHLPGVSYPVGLTDTLSSKRTSHKIAEQGRRNRINVALKEIEALLPQQILATGKKDRSASTDNEEGGEKGSSSGPGTSKASTVEMAIVYIKSLQAELENTKDKLEVAERKAKEASNSSQSSE